MRHGPMDWTGETTGTVGIDALDAGDKLADDRDSRTSDVPTGSILAEPSGVWQNTKLRRRRTTMLNPRL